MPVAMGFEAGDLVVVTGAGSGIGRATAQLAAEACAKRAMEHGVRKVDVLVRGPGSGRETAIRSLAAVGIEVVGIKDVTPIPHNGCRPKKRRRV